MQCVIFMPYVWKDAFGSYDEQESECERQGRWSSNTASPHENRLVFEECTTQLEAQRRIRQPQSNWFSEQQTNMFECCDAEYT